MRQFDPHEDPMAEDDYDILLGFFIGIYLGLLIMPILS